MLTLEKLLNWKSTTSDIIRFIYDHEKEFTNTFKKQLESSGDDLDSTNLNIRYIEMCSKFVKVTLFENNKKVVILLDEVFEFIHSITENKDFK